MSTLLHPPTSPGPVICDSCLVVPRCIHTVQCTALAAAQGVKGLPFL